MAEPFPSREYLVGAGQDIEYIWQPDGLGAWWKCLHLFNNALSRGPSAAVQDAQGATLYLKLSAINDYVYFGFLI